MDKLTLTALQESIKHWEANVAAPTMDDVGISANECALCRTFRLDADRQANLCNGCPVKASTGFHHCIGSPFDEVQETYDEWVAAIDENDEKAAEVKFRTAAQAELDFLRSLLPALSHRR